MYEIFHVPIDSSPASLTGTNSLHPQTHNIYSPNAQDEDGDLCSITSDMELEYALECRSSFIIKELDVKEEPARSLQLAEVDRPSVSTTTAATLPVANPPGLPYPQVESPQPIAQSTLASPSLAAASLSPPPPAAASPQPNLVAEQQRLSRRAEEFHREAVVLAAKAAQMQSEAAEFQRQAATYQQQAADMARTAAAMSQSIPQPQPQPQSQPQSQAPMQPHMSLASIPSVAQLSQAVAAAAQQAAMLALNQLLASNPFHHAPAPAIAAAAVHPSVVVASSEPNEYANEVQILLAAGFTDRANLVALLRQHGGNVQAVMDSMLV
jgi:hypothetical protein